MHLGALTATDRVSWAKARNDFFSQGLNKASLDVIEKAAFVLILDEENYDYDPEDDQKLSQFGAAALHGKCYDRWVKLLICFRNHLKFFYFFTGGLTNLFN